MEGLALESIGAGGMVMALVVGIILWKLFKLALKLVLFIVVAIAIAGGATVYLERHPNALPAGTLTR